MSTPTSTPAPSPTPPASLASASVAPAARHIAVAPGDDDLRRDVHAALAGRQELGPAYDEHFADTLVERLDVQIRREVDRQLRRQARDRSVGASQRHLTSAQRLGLAIPSLVFLIPLIAIAGGMDGLTGMIVACAAVVAINIAAGFF